MRVLSRVLVVLAASLVLAGVTQAKSSPWPRTLGTKAGAVYTLRNAYLRVAKDSSAGFCGYNLSPEFCARYFKAFHEDTFAHKLLDKVLGTAVPKVVMSYEDGARHASVTLRGVSRRVFDAELGFILSKNGRRLWYIEAEVGLPGNPAYTTAVA